MLVLWWITFIFLLLRFLVAAINYWFPQRLEASGTPSAELVSVLIPARNNERSIDKLLRSLVNQDYSNFEVLVYDNLSSDHTAQLVTQFRKMDKRVRFLPQQESRVPLKRSAVCHHLALEARGRYLLFLDPGVVVKKGVIQSSLRVLKRDHLGMVSLLPQLFMDSREERLLTPMWYYLLLTFVPLVLVNRFTGFRALMASPYYQLYDGELYRRHHFHLSMNAAAQTDTACLNAVKQTGNGVAMLLAGDYVEGRLFRNYEEDRNRLARALLAGFGNNVAALSLFLFFTIGAYCVFTWFTATVNIGIAFMVILYIRIMVSRLTGQDVFSNCLSHWWQMLNMAYLSLLAIQNHLNKTVNGE